MNKRNLFKELKTSLQDVKAFEKEKVTLKKKGVEVQEHLKSLSKDKDLNQPTNLLQV